MNANDKLRHAVRHLQTARGRLEEAQQEVARLTKELPQIEGTLIDAMRAAGQKEIIYQGTRYSVVPMPDNLADPDEPCEYRLAEEPFDAIILDE